jgi:hypothetical protein
LSAILAFIAAISCAFGVELALIVLFETLPPTMRCTIS